MTLAAYTPNRYTGNDSATVFDYTFKIWEDSDMEVWLTEDDVDTEVTSNFLVTDSGGVGGTVTYPVSGDPISPSVQITLKRVMPVVQDSLDVDNNQAFLAETIEGSMDQVTGMVQQNSQSLTKCLQAGETETPEDYRADMEAAAAAASASAAAAGTSETNAGNSETAAELAETNAETAETGAQTAQTAAELAETNSETAQTAAELAETNAGNSATAAATSETAAELAETNAGNSATAAATSETAAELAETNAGNSETAAATSETAAELAETNAGNSEAAAATSETNAETAKTNAETAETGAETAQAAAEAALLADVDIKVNTSYTAALNDRCIEFNNSAGDYALTVPPNSGVPFPIGYMLEVRKTGTGDITITKGSGVTFRGILGNVNVNIEGEDGFSVALEKTGADVWLLIGSIKAI